MGPIVQVYKEARDAAAKTALQEGAYSATVKGVVKPIIKSLGDALEGSSANLKAANSKFRELSQPINQMEELQAIQQSATKNQPMDILGNQAMRPSTFNSALSADGKAELSRVLTPEQMSRLENIHQDLQRQSTMRSVRPAGSDTSANENANDVLNGIIDKIVSSGLNKIPLIGGAIGSARAGAVKQGLANAYSNPAEAHDAMVSALKALQKETIPAQVKRVALQSLLGASVGSLSPQDANTLMNGANK